MKRSRQIRLLLLGGLATGFMTGCSEDKEEPVITSDTYYPNNHHISGAGYFHAPFQAFFDQPYNRFDPDKKQHFAGGKWWPEPHRSHVTVATPTPQAAAQAEAARPSVRRGGFGSTSGWHSGIWS